MAKDIDESEIDESDIDESEIDESEIDSECDSKKRGGTVKGLIKRIFRPNDLKTPEARKAYRLKSLYRFLIIAFVSNCIIIVYAIETKQTIEPAVVALITATSTLIPAVLGAIIGTSLD